ncbi:uncharacterized protein LOC111088913, partial [Limulus polyphemus]|uniref:Uncharacterized protein LOC111088913 n=1 Tax=Limulus polyphemus TaxID=6850 RepID=A0ABM1TJ64_LIMPO
FIWSISPSVVDLSGFSGNTVTVPKGNIQLGSAYAISVTVSVSSDESKWSNASLTIGVKRTSLQAVISSSNLVVGDKTPFKLDGALSFDPSNAVGDLQLLWSCSDLVTTNASCFGTSLLVSDQVLTVPAGLLLPSTYFITLKVSKDVRYAETQVTVTIRNGELPVIYIKSQKSGRINPNERLVIEGFVTSRANVTIYWEVVVEKEYSLPSLNGVTSSVVPRYYSSSLVDRPLPLLIPAVNERWTGLLGGALYKFRLTADPLDGGEPGYADVTIETNNPPVGGRLEVEPNSGFPLTTSFTLDATEGWVDYPQDYSLLYAFSYRLNENDVYTPIVSITGAPPVVENVILPGGDQTRALSVARATVLTLNSEQYGELAVRSQTLFQDVVDNMAESYLTGLEVDSTRSVLINDVLSFMEVTQLTIQPNYLREITQNNLKDLTVSLVQALSMSTTISSGPMRRLLILDKRATRTKRQSELYALPIAPTQVNVMLGMDTMITSADPSLSTMLLENDIINTYQTWSCDSVVCYGACVGSAEVAREIATVIGGSVLLGPLSQVQFFNPRTGQQMLVEDLSSPVRVTVRVEKIETDNGQVIMCGIFDLLSKSWNTDVCVTAKFDPDSRFLTCECYALGYIGAIEQESPTTRKLTTVYSTEGLLFDVETEKTSNEPTTTHLPTSTGEPTTTHLPTSTGEPTTTQLPTSTGEPTTTQLPTSTAEPTTTQLPTSTGEPTTTQLPTTTIKSTTTELPITTNEPTTTELPTTMNEPTTTELPTTMNEPTTTELPTTMNEPATTELPTTMNEPATTELPTTMNEPTTTELPTTTNEPATTELPTTTAENSASESSSTTTIQPPEAPQPITARFADSLDKVLITFSDSLRPEGLVNCSNVFNQSNLLGEDPTCVSIANTLTIQLGREPDLIPDDVLTFLPGNGLYNRDVPPELGLEATGMITVEEAVSPFTPYFELFGPREVCGGNINITVTDVTADGCHEMDYFQTILPTDTSDMTIYFGLHNLQRVISQQSPGGDPKLLSFPSEQLKEDIDYVVIMTATNRFGGESYLPSVHRIRRTNNPLALTIHGPTVVDAQRDVTFTVTVDICGEMNMTTSSLQFYWSIFPSLIDLSGFNGITATVPKGYLQLGSIYNISVTVSVSSDESKWSDASLTIGVKRTSLQAVISSSNLVVGDQTPFTLDGALSFDPSNAAGDLQLQWSCSDLVTTNTSCFGTSLLVSDQILTVPAGSLLTSTYFIKLQVSKDTRNAMSQTTVTIRQGKLPVVYIRKQKAGLINPNERLVVEGYITSRANVTIRWEVVVEKEYAIANLEGVTSSVIPRYYNSSLVNRPLALLIPAVNRQWAGLLGGALYKFRLIADPMDGGESGYADVIIETNNPPIEGRLQVEPLTGFPLTTPFTLDATEGWVDSPDDYSLTYIFSYSLSENDVDTPIISLSGAPSIVENVIFPGVPGQTTEVIVQVKVCDIWESCRIAKKKVSIQTLPFLSADGFDLINKTVLEYVNQGDYTRALSVARATAVTLNNVQFQELGNRSQNLFQDVVDKMAEGYLTGLEMPISSVLTNDVLSLLAIAQTTIQPSSLRDVTQQNLADVTFLLVQSLSGSAPMSSWPMRRLLVTGKRAIRKKRQTESYLLPISPVKVNVMLGMNSMITSADPSPSTVENLFDSINMYLSGMCQYLVVGEDPAIIWTTLVALRSEKLEFDSLVGRSTNLAFLDTGQNSHWMIFGSDLINTYQTWTCDSEICYGACVGSAEVALEIATVIGGSDLLGPLLQIQLFNPRTGQQMLVEDLSSPVTVTVRVENIKTGSDRVVACGLFNLATRSWNTDTCVTINHDLNTGILTCECTALGYVGAILGDIKTTTLPSTTAESTTTDVPTVSLEPTTTIVPFRLILPILIKLNHSYNTLVEGRESAFIDNISKQLATYVGTSTRRMQDTVVWSGEGGIKYSFALWSEENPSEIAQQELQDAVDSLIKQHKEGAITLYDEGGNVLDVDYIMYNYINTSPVAMTTTAMSQEFEKLIEVSTVSSLTTVQSPEAPQPTTGRFSDSLDRVLIKLSDSVRPEGLVNCSSLFNQSSLDLLGEGPTCVSIANTLTVQLGREPDLIPDDVLTFLPGNGLYNRDVPPELGLEATGTVTVKEADSPIIDYQPIKKNSRQN